MLPMPLEMSLMVLMVIFTMVMATLVFLPQRPDDATGKLSQRYCDEYQSRNYCQNRFFHILFLLSVRRGYSFF